MNQVNKDIPKIIQSNNNFNIEDGGWQYVMNNDDIIEYTYTPALYNRRDMIFIINKR